MTGNAIDGADVSPCQSCGACCSYSENWPRFTVEDDAQLDLIPPRFVNARQSGMRCEGDRCSALSGRVGEATRCEVYAVRPAPHSTRRSASRAVKVRVPDCRKGMHG